MPSCRCCCVPRRRRNFRRSGSRSCSFEFLERCRWGKTKTSEEKSSLVFGLTMKSVFEGFVAELQVVVDILHIVIVFERIEEFEDFLLLRDV